MFITQNSNFLVDDRLGVNRAACAQESVELSSSEVENDEVSETSVLDIASLIVQGEEEQHSSVVLEDGLWGLGAVTEFVLCTVGKYSEGVHLNGKKDA